MRLLAYAIIAMMLPFGAFAQDVKESEMIPVLDLHADTLNRAMNEKVDLMTAPYWVWATIPKLEEGGVVEQVYAVWVDSKELDGCDATKRALQMIDFFNQQAEEYKDRIALATSMDEADAIRESGRVAAFLWIEGGAPIDEDLGLLRLFHQLGIRGMTLAWMNNLSWAGSSTDEENPNMGLTEFGRDVVREMNRLGMVVDVSHVSEQTFYDAVEVSTDPVVLTHSGCKALSDHPRNVTDDQLRAMAKSGGVIGIVAYPSYLEADYEPRWDSYVEKNKDKIEQFKKDYIQKHLDERGTEPAPRDLMQARIAYTRSLLPEEADMELDVFIDHIDHAIEVAGWEHVALGSDFDGIWILPKGMNDASDWQIVADALRARGHSEEVIRGVMGENARRVFRQVMD